MFILISSLVMNAGLLALLIAVFRARALGARDLPPHRQDWGDLALPSADHPGWQRAVDLSGNPVLVNGEVRIHGGVLVVAGINYFPTHELRVRRYIHAVAAAQATTLALAEAGL